MLLATVRAGGVKAQPSDPLRPGAAAPPMFACGVVNWRWRHRFGAVRCIRRTELAENGLLDAELLGLATPDATARLT